MSGILLYDGPSQLDGEPIIAVATGVRTPSRNTKTGPMVQVWILHRDLDPFEELRIEHSSICGDCPLRDNGCYVTIGQAPSTVFRAYQAGQYPTGTAEDLRGEAIRLGAYGDPRALPLDLVRRLTEVASTWTGYTHLWEWKGSYRYRPYLMASVETKAQARRARRRKWRTFRIRGADESSKRRNGKEEVVCPNETAGVQCIDCGLCSGTDGRGSKSITIAAHGTRKARVLELIGRREA